ncbi:hypothetical protein NLI96_g1520 [Meripilus lineatus]|uniref:Glutamine synthetase n=1 Tax=Meripilus lineatus TaxID=2056292 RepID=A0AAD5VA64_9APHY|nr:hypothetical protein NLI96_g1520 [Physisporinus lineatus]
MTIDLTYQNAVAFGVIYTPGSVKEPTPTETLSILSNPAIKFVRLQWLDYTNTVRFRLLPTPYFKKLLSSSRPGTGVSICTLGIVVLTLAPGFSPNGEYLLVPDLSSLRISSYAPGHAVVMSYLQEKFPNPEHGLVVPIDPRTLLKRVVDGAAQKAGVSFLVGFETEFILLKETRPKPVAVNDADWSTSRKLPTGQIETTVLEEISDVLQEAGIEVQLIHAEAAPGQYEVVTGPLPPLESADALVFTRETIYNIASKHGLRATLAPRIHLDSTGSAAHAHISVHPIDTRSTGDLSGDVAPTLSSHSRSFLQSLLNYLPSITIFGLPTKFSYARMHDGIWSGGTWAGWGIEAREVPIRVTGGVAPPTLPGGQGGGQHFEIRCVDGTANPYLTLAAIVGVGAKGVAENLELTTRSVGTFDGAKSIAEMSDLERKESGVGTLRLPLTLPEARKRLGQDETVREILGDDFVTKYLSVNETLERVFVADTEEEIVSKLVEYF